VVRFAEGRIGYREWARRNGRLADMHSIDDRYDHDIDELMAYPQIPFRTHGADSRTSAPYTLAENVAPGFIPD